MKRYILTLLAMGAILALFVLAVVIIATAHF